MFAFNYARRKFGFDVRDIKLDEKSSYFIGEFDPGSGRTLAACLIHASRAQEASRSLRGDACGMSGGRVSNTWATCLADWDNSGKPELIPDDQGDRMIPL